MEEQELIFGKDNTENIVSIEVDDNLLYIYKETSNGIEQEVRKNKYWLVSDKFLNDSRKLKGDSYYKYIKEYTSRNMFLADRKRKGFNTFSVYNPKESTLIRQGITYFKGMQVEDVSVLSFDIEATGLTHNSNSKVLLISNTFEKKGQIIKKLFAYDEYTSEADMFDDWCAWVREINPSVICGHNIFGYDLPYLAFCADKAGTQLELGRDGSPISFNMGFTSSFRKDGSQTYDYHEASIHGREIIDTFFLSIKYDIGRKYESYRLKTIIKHEGLEKEGRQHYDAAKISQNYTDPIEWAKIKEYAKDDADDALSLYKLMIPSFFYYNQSIPKTFQQVINTASGSQLNAFMIRAYLRSWHSLPKKSEPEKYEGAVSMGIPGVYKNVKKVDVASLYPSIMREYKVYDSNKDPYGYLLKAVEYFTDQRLENKKLGKETGNKYYKDLEQAQKIVINSMYGFLGTPGLLFNSPANAAFVTRKGREIVTKAIEWATGHTIQQVVKNSGLKSEGTEWAMGERVSEGKGYVLVNADTDSISYTNGSSFHEQQFKEEIEELNSLYPNDIKWENDGTYDKVVVIKTKNYILQSGDKIKYKGSSIKDQKKEKALLDLLHDVIGCILDDRHDNIEHVYDSFIKEAYNIKDINRWTVKKTITKAILNPERTNELKVRDALEGVHIQEGDKVWLYSALDGEVQAQAKGELVFLKNNKPKMIPNEILKRPELWTGDENKMHYVKRVYNTISILSNVIDMDKLKKYHLKSNHKLLENL